MKAPVFYLLTIFLVLWVQAAANLFAGSTGFSINTVLIAVLYFGLTRGAVSGAVLGFLWGLLFDASMLGLLGLHAFIFTTAGFFAGMLRRQLDEDKFWTQSIFTFAVSLFYICGYFIIDRIFSFGTHRFSWSIAVQPFINGLLAPLFFWGLTRWSQVWDMAPQD
jgi:rod shape-determining protein MreD